MVDSKDSMDFLTEKNGGNPKASMDFFGFFQIGCQVTKAIPPGAGAKPPRSQGKTWRFKDARVKLGEKVIGVERPQI